MWAKGVVDMQDGSEGRKQPNVMLRILAVTSRVPLSGLVWLLGGVLLFITGWCFVAGAECAVDLAFADEVSYMSLGLNIARDGLPSAANSVFYSVWYLMLHACSGTDHVGLFYLNYLGLTVLIPVLLYLVLLRVGARFLVAFLSSVWVLIALANFAIQPKVTHFAAALVLFTLFLSSMPRSTQAGLAIAALGALLVSYVRPEFFLLFLVLGLTCIGWSVREWLRVRSFRCCWAAVAVLLVAGIAFVLLGLPAFGDDDGRSMCAFGQHFGIRWVVEARSPLNPAVDWKAIVAQNFGDAESIGAAARANPRAFFLHLIANLRDLPRFWWRLAWGHYPLSRSGGAADVWMALGGVGCMAALFLWPSLQSIRARFRRSGRTICIAVGFLVLGVLPSVIMYPRPHYMILPTVLMAIIITFCLCGEQWASIRTSITVLSFCAALAVPFLVTPIRASINPRAVRPNFSTVECIKSFGVSKPVALLDAEGGYEFYSGDLFSRVSHYKKDVPFETFMADNVINGIVVSAGLMRDVRYVKDPEWQKFLREYPSRGFVRKDVPGVGRSVLIHRAALGR
jgi:hypothetical protein